MTVDSLKKQISAFFFQLMQEDFVHPYCIFYFYAITVYEKAPDPYIIFYG